VRELILDGASWRTQDDVYDAFFRAVGAPAWHGRNFNALRDSIATGSINAIDLPYRLLIKNYDLIGENAKQMAAEFANLIREIASEGYPVQIRTENSNGAKPY